MVSGGSLLDDKVDEVHDPCNQFLVSGVAIVVARDDHSLHLATMDDLEARVDLHSHHLGAEFLVSKVGMVHLVGHNRKVCESE